MKPTDIAEIEILKRSLDLRHRQNDIRYIYTFRIAFNADVPRNSKLEFCSTPQSANRTPIPQIAQKTKPVIIGCGPAGLFAAYQFIQNGISPIIVERGQRIAQRKKDIDLFLQTRQINTESNICFGEGGAGTFSDGKLTSRSKDRRQREVLDTLVRYGADASILYEQRPHLGTDVMQQVISRLTDDLLHRETEIYFGSTMQDIVLEKGNVRAVICNDRKIRTDTVIFAGGHSARDVYELFLSKNVAMESKNFAVGLRIEHLREDIDKTTYQKHYKKIALPAAEYILKYKDISGRGVYTFCNCPGGMVIACITEQNTLCVNGMSYSRRDGKNTNSAVVVTVTKEDFGGTEPLAGIAFQRKIERAAFIAGGGDYSALTMSVGEFLSQVEDKGFRTVRPTYRPQAKNADLREVLPDALVQTLQNALKDFGKKLHGFDSAKAMLTGVESRTSSPVRILRDENGESINTKGLYVAGEGSGYAGGIVSSAIDGMRVAQSILIKKSTDL